MSRFENTNTGVVVIVDDSKDERFGEGWKKATATKKAAAKPAPKSD